ncbi:ead/Ea22-like family protein [Glutamicibacter protophormiae]|uniref:ead/Ea22-like family protein n=1 Tax=Glutamicibacter protophormiae TaxID=37930 RepID=UPI001957BEDB|nr:ead/Ea22-like family protein [Glutamicibacter protophormiae]QRQ79142.1 ead/Ea22-like family protein [Glutamicibacter protophormiae]
MELNELRKTAEAPGVRPGPWHVYDRGIGYEVHDENDYELTGGMRETFDKPDAEFIATFDPPTVLALLSRLEQAEQAVARVREVAAEYRPSIPEEVLHEVMKDILRALDGDGRG